MTLTSTANPQPALLTMKQAAAYLGMRLRWMYEVAHLIPRVDMRLPGATKPVWRYLRTDLDAFALSRRTAGTIPLPDPNANSQEEIRQEEVRRKAHHFAVQAASSASVEVGTRDVRKRGQRGPNRRNRPAIQL
jgi:hypothetical protein